MDYEVIKTYGGEGTPHTVVKVSEDVYFLVVNFYGNSWCAWKTTYNEECQEWRDSVSIANSKYNKPLETFDEFVEKCISVMDTCPECGKHIPLNEQKRVGFANRCCPDCYPKMKEKLEYKGWTC